MHFSATRGHLAAAIPPSTLLALARFRRYCGGYRPLCGTPAAQVVVSPRPQRHRHTREPDDVQDRRTPRCRHVRARSLRLADTTQRGAGSARRDACTDRLGGPGSGRLLFRTRALRTPPSTSNPSAVHRPDRFWVRCRRRDAKHASTRFRRCALTMPSYSLAGPKPAPLPNVCAGTPVLIRQR